MKIEQERFVNPLTFQVPEHLRQLDPTVTSEEVVRWINCFRLGQSYLADMYGRREITPCQFVPAIYDAVTGTITDNCVAYVQGGNLIVGTYGAMYEGIKLTRDQELGTLGDLTAFDVWFEADDLMILSGVEEESHSVFEKAILRQLNPMQVQVTRKYDGSDTFEVRAQRDVLNVIERYNIGGFTRDHRPITDMRGYVRSIKSGYNL